MREAARLKVVEPATTPERVLAEAFAALSEAEREARRLREIIAAGSLSCGSRL